MADEQTTTPEGVITIGDFTKIQLRVGRVIDAGDHPNADKLLVFKVDLGDEQRQICAGLRGHYTADELMGLNLIIVTNLALRMMRGLESQGMLLAAGSSDHSKVVLLTTESDVEPGSSIS